MRIHTGEKPFECPTLDCTKCFKQISNLQKHLDIHRDKGYIVTCKYCKKEFSKRVILRHASKCIKKESDEEYYSCQNTTTN